MTIEIGAWLYMLYILRVSKYNIASISRPHTLFQAVIKSSFSDSGGTHTMHTSVYFHDLMVAFIRIELISLSELSSGKYLKRNVFVEEKCKKWSKEACWYYVDTKRNNQSWNKMVGWWQLAIWKPCQQPMSFSRWEIPPYYYSVQQLLTHLPLDRSQPCLTCRRSSVQSSIYSEDELNNKVGFRLYLQCWNLKFKAN